MTPWPDKTADSDNFSSGLARCQVDLAVDESPSPVRGRAGGYQLARGLAEITLLELIDALAAGDDQERLHPRSCPIAPADMCSAHVGMVEVNDRVRALLAETTLASVLGAPCSDEVSVASESDMS